MRLDPRFIGWGLFFIVFGAVLLGARQGWIPDDLVDRAWQLWPLVLVGIGLSILLAKRPGSQIGGLVVAVTFGIIAGSALAGGGFPFGGCGGDVDQGTPFGRESGDLGNGATVEVNFSCGELTVGTGSGAAWSLEGTSEGGVGPDISRDNDRLKLETGEGRGPFGFGGASTAWRLTLPTEPAIAADLGVNAGSGSIDLAGANLSRLGATVNAGSLRLDLRDAAALGGLNVGVNAGSAIVWLPELAFDGEITANAGSATICAPDSVGLRLVVGSNPISSNDFGQQGLVQVGDAWESPDFAAAGVRVTLRTAANAGSLSLNPARDCAG
ncbi:MAG TPA: DUF5668 domain-containing protein [Candidatus Limnocylindrales bacterium]|nr:DUF5668 domain-containing protein [Candidatus Limnocylindrales bacterium]